MRVGTWHLTYCTNVHGGETWSEHFHALESFVPRLRAQVSPEGAFGLGLRLSARAAADLAQRHALEAFRAWLAENHCYVFTLNGFPFGRFHDDRVKEQVYAPDWRTPERFGYTLLLAELLARLLPPGVEGSISTCPLFYAPRTRLATRADLRQACEPLVEAAIVLARLEHDTGTTIRLALEPEPDGALEDSGDVLTFFEEFLIPCAVGWGARVGLSAHEMERTILRHVGVCLDTCHLAVVFESAEEACRAFARRGITVAKIQLSSAVRALLPQSRSERAQVIRSLGHFAEPVYLHQTMLHTESGARLRFPDLPQALTVLDRHGGAEVRSHFHVPLPFKSDGILSSTQAELAGLLEFCRATPALCQHLEIETYTWAVLPRSLRRSLVESVASEFHWTLARLTAIPNLRQRGHAS